MRKRRRRWRVWCPSGTAFTSRCAVMGCRVWFDSRARGRRGGGGKCIVYRGRGGGCAMPCGSWVVQGMVTVKGKGGEAHVAGAGRIGGRQSGRRLHT